MHQPGTRCSCGPAPQGWIAAQRPTERAAAGQCARRASPTREIRTRRAARRIDPRNPGHVTRDYSVSNVASKGGTMRVFVAGASGAIGSRLVPQLIKRRHEVIGSARSPDKSERLRALGAKPVVLDLFDRRAVRDAVLDAKPEAIVHQATALSD